MGNISTQPFILEMDTGLLRKTFATFTVEADAIGRGRTVSESVVDYGGEEDPHRIRIPLSLSQLWEAVHASERKGEPLDLTRTGVARIKAEYPELENKPLTAGDIARAYSSPSSGPANFQKI